MESELESKSIFSGRSRSESRSRLKFPTPQTCLGLRNPKLIISASFRKKNEQYCLHSGILLFIVKGVTAERAHVHNCFQYLGNDYTH